MRYLKLLILFLKNSLMIDLEYRANFVFAFIMAIIDAVWSVGAVLVLYSFTDQIGGWTFYESIVVIGLLFVAYGLLDAVVLPNIQALSEHIRTGTMDFILTKPVHSQFTATFQRIKVDRFSSLCAGAGLIAYALSHLHATPTFSQIILFIALVISAQFIMYAVLCLCGTVLFWVVEADAMSEIVYALLEVGRYPASAIPQPVRAIVTFVIPIAFVTTIPAEVLLGKLTSAPVLLSWVIAGVLCFACIRFWGYAVRHYGSASS